jgi:mRNA-degrading endonuclease toxin of MazEF toxin-antitoxin module
LTVRTALALPAELLAAADRAVPRGRARSRNGLVARALRHELARERRRDIDAAFAAMSRPRRLRRDAAGRSRVLPIVVAVPCTTYRAGRRLYPSHVFLRTPDGGLSVDSVARVEPVRTMSKQRLTRYRGVLSADAWRKIDRALVIVLDRAGAR